MSYVKNFKKFLKHEEKQVTTLGANPQMVDEQGAAPAQTPQPTASANPNDPAVQTANAKLTDIDAKIAALTTQIGQLQSTRALAMAELNKANAAAQKAASAAQTT